MTPVVLAFAYINVRLTRYVCYIYRLLSADILQKRKQEKGNGRFKFLTTPITKCGRRHTNDLDKEDEIAVAFSSTE